jgi:hypothetical protein
MALLVPEIKNRVGTMALILHHRNHRCIFIRDNINCLLHV